MREGEREEEVRRIPRKARRMLGIGRSTTTREGEVRDIAKGKRIKVVRISVGVIAQRLMEAVKGGWVVELWAAVGVCVELVEGRKGERDRGGEEWL